ncbi:MAG: hypothetical protein H0X62_04755 [Bacteroidetes bacterium]|nr:hypothetical protein [Bacteroidota bacterium]
MIKQEFGVKFEKEVFVISSFFTIYILYWFFSKNDFALYDYSKLYISQATLDGVDVSARIKTLYTGLVSAFILFPSFYFLFTKLATYFEIEKKYLQVPSVIGISGVFLILSDIIGVYNGTVIKLILILLIISLISIAFKEGRWRLLAEPSFIGNVMVFSLIVLALVLFLFNSTPSVTENSVWLFMPILLATSLMLLYAKKLTGLFLRRLFSFLLPMALVPLFIFFSIELLFFVESKNGIFIPYKWVFISLGFLALLILSVIIYLKPIKLSSEKLFLRFYAPSALLSFLLLTIYIPVPELSHELFELANPAIPQMRLFAFNEIPMVDFMSSHMFAEQFYGFIHNLLFGYNGDLSFQRYIFLLEMLFFMVAYFFMLKIFKNHAISLLFLLIFPFLYFLFPVHLFFGILAFFAVCKIMAIQSVKNYSLLILLIISLCMWQLDTGASTIFATAFFLPLSFYTERQKVNFSSLFKTIGLFLIFATVIILLLLTIRQPQYLIDNFMSAIHYASANQAHGYSIIAFELNHHFFLHHVILPGIAVLFILYIIYILRNKLYSISKTSRFTLSASLFLYLFYIGNLQRGIVRHGFLEYLDSFLSSTFYLATVLFAISFIKTENPFRRYIVFFSFSFLLIITIKYFPIGQGNSRIENFLSQSTIKNLDYYFIKESFEEKILGNNEFAKQNYDEIKLFLDKHISADQTFLDFSNTPMLYYYCQRKVPSYFCQTLQNTVDDYLQLQHLKRITPKTVPVVIYSNYPVSGFDQTDGVPNSMRQYLIAEYIYKNYKPFGIINKHSVWVSKNKDILTDDKPEADTVAVLPQVHHYKNAASIINKHFLRQQDKVLKFVGEEKPLPNQPEGFSLFEIKAEISELNGVFLNIFMDNPTNNEEFTVELLSENGQIAKLLFNPSENEKEYMLRISNHYLWHIDPPKYAKIYDQGDSRINKIEFYKDLRK